MNNWPFRILTITGPAVAVMLAMFFLEPDDQTPEPFWDVAFAFVMSSFLISLPQIFWTLICLPELLSKEVYWGGLIAVQIWLVAYGVWGVLEVRSHPEGDSIWFLYFPPCALLIPFGACCGVLVRKYRHKEDAA